MVREKLKSSLMPDAIIKLWHLFISFCNKFLNDRFLHCIKGMNNNIVNNCFIWTLNRPLAMLSSGSHFSFFNLNNPNRAPSVTTGTGLIPVDSFKS